jgi:hypothetical protein
MPRQLNKHLLNPVSVLFIWQSLLQKSGSLSVHYRMNRRVTPISASPGVDVKSSKATRAAVMTRLMLAALAGLISAFASICTTVIYSTVLGWRNFWLGVCVAGFVALVVFLWMACKRSKGPEVYK